MDAHVLETLYGRAKRIHGDGRLVARRAGISRAKLDGLSTGDLAGWTTSMVERLARVALVDAAIVWGGGAVSQSPTLAFLRSDAWPDFQQDDLPVLMLALARAGSLRRLAELLRVEVLSFRPQAVAGQRAYEQAYVLAESVRAALGRPTEPLTDLHDLMGRRFAIYVSSDRLLTVRLEAATIKDAHGEAVVLNRSRERRAVMVRRSLAHELCHALFDPRERSVQASLDASEALAASDQSVAPAEQRARAFAAEILVPRAGLLGAFGPPRALSSPGEALALVARVADHFVAPPELVANHLSNRAYVDPAIREYVAERARDEVHPGPDEDASVDVLGEYVRTAVAEGHITSGRGRELMLEGL